MALDAVDAITGSALASQLRSTYNEDTAPKRYDRMGDKMLGRNNRIQSTFAQRGDIHLIRIESKHTFAVDMGSGVAVATRHGARVIPKKAVEKFLITWRI